MGTTRHKGPKVIIDFTDEIVRQLAAESIKQVVGSYIQAETSVDTKTAAEFLGFSQPTFREHHAKRIARFEYGTSVRFRIADLIAYRDKNKITPQ